MIFYEYDTDGWLVGWHLDPARPRSTSTDYAPIPPARARWVESIGWTEDVAREAAELVAPRLARAWSAADAHAQAGMDANSRTSLLWLAVDPSCPAWRRERILAVQAWWAATWAHYATVKARIAAGEDARFDAAAVGSCPWSIWQIAADAP
jgi:hypothetical protein